MENERKERKPPVSTRFGIEVDTERADVGRDIRSRLARPNSRRPKRRGKFTFPNFPFKLSDHRKDWQSYRVDAQFVERDDHTYNK